MTQGVNGERHVFGSNDRPNRLWRSASRYTLAIIVTLIAFAATFGLKREWPAPVFLFFVVAVALSAWYGGRGPSIAAAVLSLVLAKYTFKEPVGTLRINRLAELIPFVVFFAVACIITATIEALRRARGLAESHAAELERLNEEMRHALLSRRLLAAEESERRRISRVLHEDVGQLLTAVRMNLQRLVTPVGGDSSVVADSIRLVDESLAHLRALSVELRPTVLDDLGLGEAVTWYANRHADRAGYDIRVEQALGDRRLPEPVETAAFRIVQQALTNIARHAQAKSVQIALRRDSRGVELSIADDGIGFDVGDARARSQAGESLGLVHMTELAYMAGGILSVNSTRDSGSTVHVQFPVSSVE
jgi:signal transduction histidine kinase